jgi:hypothetical protein
MLTLKCYTLSFTFKRITNGFLKMSAWEEVYDRDERTAFAACFMHRKFSL